MHVLITEKGEANAQNLDGDLLRVYPVECIKRIHWEEGQAIRVFYYYNGKEAEISASSIEFISGSHVHKLYEKAKG